MRWSGVAGVALANWMAQVAALDFPGPAPGRPRATLRAGEVALGNRAIEQCWRCENGKLAPLEVKDRLGGREVGLEGGEVFRITLGDGLVVKASELRVVAPPVVETLQA
jgi:hypothetical protein